MILRLSTEKHTDSFLARAVNAISMIFREYFFFLIYLPQVKVYVGFFFENAHSLLVIVRVRPVVIFFF